VKNKIKELNDKIAKRKKLAKTFDWICSKMFRYEKASSVKNLHTLKRQNTKIVILKDKQYHLNN
jgi:hypothetical protein